MFRLAWHIRARGYDLRWLGTSRTMRAGEASSRLLRCPFETRLCSFAKDELQGDRSCDSHVMDGIVCTTNTSRLDELTPDRYRGLTDRSCYFLTIQWGVLYTPVKLNF